MANMDDVDFMQEYSERNSAVFLVDSGSRNRTFFPGPSEYLIEFSEPIRNVFGMDILDASIPSTMYNIDFNNNRLRYYLTQPVTDGYENLATVASDFTSAFDIMACSSAFTTAMDDSTAPYDVFLAAEDEWQAELQGRLQGDPMVRLQQERSSIIVITYSIEHARLVTLLDTAVQAYGLETADLAAPSPPSSSSSPSLPNMAPAAVRTVMRDGVLYFKTRGIWYGTADTHLQTIITERVSSSTSFDNICVLLADVTPTATSPTHDIVFTHSYNVAVNAANAAAQLSFLGGLGSTEWRVTMRVLEVELGNYNLGSLSATLSDGIGSLGFRIMSTSSGNLEKQNMYMFANIASPFIFDMKNSTIAEVLGFDTLPQSPANTITLPTNRNLFVSSLAGSSNDFRLRAPGIVNLLGVRYLTLRCPEIEDHIHGSRAYGSHSTGIGVFKLPAPNEVANLRFDFINLIRRPFHPLGRMPRLTFRFEFDNGVLYDFKGINHQILITVKYYSPPRAPRPIKSVLNPDYDPDYPSYVQRVIDYAERSDDDSDNDNADRIRNTRYMRDKQHPGSAARPRQKRLNNAKTTADRGAGRAGQDMLQLRELLALEQQYDHSTTDEDEPQHSYRTGKKKPDYMRTNIDTDANANANTNTLAGAEADDDTDVDDMLTQAITQGRRALYGQ